jgi:hypothetical protein
MARDKAEQAERVAWERAAQDMRSALIGYARDDAFVKDLALGLGTFWQDRYALDTVHLMSVDESLRFFDWFAHDYRLQAHEDAACVGKRLIEVYRAEVSDALTDKEADILDGWIASAPGSAFVLERTDPAQSTVHLRDLLASDRVLTAHDASAAVHGEVGQILLARPLPEHNLTRLTGATVVLPISEKEALLAFVDEACAALPISEKEALLAFVDEACAAYLAEHEGATRDQFMRERAYLLTHYALEWADREGRPAVAAEDPDARRPGGKAMQTLIKWQQERVQVKR